MPLQLEEKISAAFHGGEFKRRELRLAAHEAAWVAESLPVQVTPMGEDWYEIIFLRGARHGG